MAGETGQPEKPAAPAKVETPSLPPIEMIGAELKAFFREKLKTGEPVTIEIGKDSFTGRIFRLMLDEGWIAIEHVDGRRRAFYVYEGGKIKSASGHELALAGAAAK